MKSSERCWTNGAIYDGKEFDLEVAPASTHNARPTKESKLRGTDISSVSPIIYLSNTSLPF
jgi:hypothetical protein